MLASKGGVKIKQTITCTVIWANEMPIAPNEKGLDFQAKALYGIVKSQVGLKENSSMKGFSLTASSGDLRAENRELYG